MCGRFTLHHTPVQIAKRFDAQPSLFETQPRYNIAPTQPVATVRENGMSSRTSGLVQMRALEAFQWGLVPFWAKDPEIGNRLINARAETLVEKPAFKHALNRRRCLIPADGFFEWRKEGSRRTPMYIRMRDGSLFAFAGLWEEWTSPDGSPLRTCAIITVEPNSLLAPIHNRMPAILRPEDEGTWLDMARTRAPDALALLRPYSADRMEAYPVSRRVNAPANDDPACILPVGQNEPELSS
jgi:putative SOS response-associated peptidase YedK